jgi:hypothetical protein
VGSQLRLKTEGWRSNSPLLPLQECGFLTLKTQGLGGISEVDTIVLMAEDSDIWAPPGPLGCDARPRTVPRPQYNPNSDYRTAYLTTPITFHLDVIDVKDDVHEAMTRGHGTTLWPGN